MAKARFPISVSLRDGGTMRLRPPPATDLSTAYELFVDEVYRPALDSNLGSVTRIVDLGANVGLSVLYFAKKFPRAELTAFEPHPKNLEHLRKNIAINRLGQRVQVIGAAATVSDGTVNLSDSENTSTVTSERSDFRVPARDLFAEVGDATVDILKIDVEGAEYALLADPRFEKLRPRFVIMEWHGTQEDKTGADWCRDRLEQLGYAVTLGATGNFGGLAIGTLWARRPD